MVRVRTRDKSGTANQRGSEQQNESRFRPGLAVGAQAGAGQRREEGEPEEDIEAEPRRRAAMPAVPGAGALRRDYAST